MSQVIYSNDTRYPGPPIHPPPREITGLPTNEELDAYPRMFEWGELKEIVSEYESAANPSSRCTNYHTTNRDGHVRTAHAE